jgi:hypothetical protein
MNSLRLLPGHTLYYIKRAGLPVQRVGLTWYIDGHEATELEVKRLIVQRAANLFADLPLTLEWLATSPAYLRGMVTALRHAKGPPRYNEQLHHLVGEPGNWKNISTEAYHEHFTEQPAVWTLYDSYYQTVQTFPDRS